MKKISFIFISFLFAFTCYAQEECDHKFFGSIPAKMKVVGTAPDGKDLTNILYMDSSGNLLNGSLCQYKNSTLILKINAINGKAEGLSQAWYENGNKKWESEMKNGGVNGISKYFFEDGTLDKIFKYQMGKAISAECANGYKWTESEVSKWNYGGEIRNSVRNICRSK